MAWAPAVLAVALACVMSGCGGGAGTDMTSLPEEQQRPDAGLDASAKLKNMEGPAAPQKKRR